MANDPLISVITPTLNAEKVLKVELNSIRSQNYPQNKIEIIIADGGSTDGTLDIAKQFGARIYSNPLKTGEAGKAIATKKASGKYVALIDSDNVLPDTNWIRKMIEPLELDEKVVGSEPWKFTYRKDAGFIERYSALIGANDPIVLWYGNYDRVNAVSKKWTGLKLNQKDKGGWLEVELKSKAGIPTIGANGTIFRSEFLRQFSIDQYLFDIDIIALSLQKFDSLKFAKVKIGIIHTYCESSISKFARKQKRRILDYYYYNSLGLRNTKWESKGTGLIIIKFAIGTVLIFPTLIYSLIGYIKKPDLAWFFHPLACYITLYEYFIGMLNFKLFKKVLKRDGWSQ